MLFALPPADTLYDALLARDPSYDGRALVGVTSTGIFCRLTCPARKPKRENCRFYETPAEALEAGFRPCRRCHPMGGDPVVRDLIAVLEDDPARRWTEADLVARGYDPSTVRRTFRRQTGLTFLEIARQRRLASGVADIARGGRVIDGQLSAGYASASGFRAALSSHLGCTPSALTADAPLKASWIETPLGSMVAVASDRALHLLEFADRPALAGELTRLRKTTGMVGLGETDATRQIRAELAAFFAGDGARFETPLGQPGTPFQHSVWRALREIPPGQTRSYADLARAIDRPTATRAVARANGANTLAIVVPCHRVIGADGSLTGYGGGLWRKDRLIALEHQYRSTQ